MAEPYLQQASAFARLPAEVMTRITRWLTTTDYIAVRKTCRLVERKTFNQWAYEFFRKKQFMISSFSLNALIEISQHPHLRLVLKHVIIAIDAYPHDARAGLDPSLDAPARDESLAKEWALARSDQHWLLTTGSWIPLLTQALSSLPNLTTVDLRDFNSRTRFRDGAQYPWTSYGSRRLQAFQKTQFPYPHGGPSYGRPYQDSILPGIFLALANSGAKPESLEIMTRTSKTVSDEALYIPPDVLPRLKPVLQNLRKFHVAVDSFGTNATPMSNLCRLISLMPNLTWLRVGGAHLNSWQAPGFWAWLGDPVSAPASDPAFAEMWKDAPPIALPHLETLDIGPGCIEHEWLLPLVEKFGLRSMTLHNVKFYQKGYTEADAKARYPPINYMSIFLKSLSGTTVRRFRVSNCQQVGGEHPMNGLDFYEMDIMFQNDEEAYQEGLELPSRRYSGGDMFKQAAWDMKIRTEFAMYDSDDDVTDDPED